MFPFQCNTQPPLLHQGDRMVRRWMRADGLIFICTGQWQQFKHGTNLAGISSSLQMFALLFFVCLLESGLHCSHRILHLGEERKKKKKSLHPVFSTMDSIHANKWKVQRVTLYTCSKCLNYKNKTIQDKGEKKTKQKNTLSEIKQILQHREEAHCCPVHGFFCCLFHFSTKAAHLFLYKSLAK